MVVNATIVDKEKYKEEMSEFKKFLENLTPTDFKDFPAKPTRADFFSRFPGLKLSSAVAPERSRDDSPPPILPADWR